MPSTPANAINLTQDSLAKWFVENLPYVKQIARVWNFMGVEGGSISYSRVPPLEDLTNIDNFATILGDGSTTGITVKTTDGPTANTTFVVGTLGTRYKLEYRATDSFKYPNELDSQQSAIAMIRLIYMHFRKLEKLATAASGDYPSLPELCFAENMFSSANGSALQRLEELQRAYSIVTANDGRPNAIMCNSRARRWIIAAYQGAGLNIELVDCAWSDPIKGSVTAKLPAINGTPIYVNDLLASNINGDTTGEDNRANIYFMVLGDNGEAGPARGITSIVPAPLKDTMFVRRESPEPASATTTSLINVDYTFPVGLAMGSQGALAILGGVDVSTYPWFNTGA